MGSARAGLLGVVVTAIVVAVWMCLRGGAVVPPAVGDQQGAADAQAAAVSAVGVGERPAREEDLAARSGAIVVGVEGAGAPALRFWCEVLDAADAPVEGATVAIWAARSERRAPDEDDRRAVVWLGPERSSPLATGTTGPDGRCEFEVHREWAYLTAAHPDLGSSIARAVGPFELGTDRVLELWLLRPVTIRGLVVDENAQPVPFALVRDTALDRPLGKFQPTGETAAGRDGRFEFEVAAGQRCELSARCGAFGTSRVAITADADVDVVLPFAGAFSIRAADPFPGVSFQLTAILLRGDAAPDPRGQFAHGYREADVAQPGRYHVYGEVKRDGRRFAAGPVEVTVSFASPHPVALLQDLRETAPASSGPQAALQRATIAGRVWLPDGQPCTNFALEWSARSEFRGARVKATIDGNAFRFEGELPPSNAAILVRPTDANHRQHLIGPFAAGQHEVFVQLPATAQVRVQLYVHGREARGLAVGFASVAECTIGPQNVGADGSVLLRMLPATAGKLFVNRGRETVRIVDVELQPGRNRDIVLDVLL
ncbi:MAG: carboxypeptidase-like regulatory domain-containing protein [Planctomycetota bacterium]